MNGTSYHTSFFLQEVTSMCLSPLGLTQNLSNQMMEMMSLSMSRVVRTLVDSALVNCGTGVEADVSSLTANWWRRINSRGSAGVGWPRTGKGRSSIEDEAWNSSSRMESSLGRLLSVAVQDARSHRRFVTSSIVNSWRSKFDRGTALTQCPFSSTADAYSYRVTETSSVLSSTWFLTHKETGSTSIRCTSCLLLC